MTMFTSRKRGSHLANEGISFRAAYAQSTGLLTEGQMAKRLGTSKGAVGRWLTEVERHHHLTPAGRVVWVRYFSPDIDEDELAYLCADKQYLAYKRAQKGYDIPAIDAALEEWQKAAGVESYATPEPF